MSRRKPQGQTVLITVLVLTIALTVALSLIRRTISDVKTTGVLEESARAFSVAEAGIEDVLKRASGTTATIQSGNGTASFNTTYTTIGGSMSEYTNMTSTEKGDVGTVWLVGHLADNSMDETGDNDYCKDPGPCLIDVCWTSTVGQPLPAVEIGVLYKTISTGVYAIKRYANDPDPVRIGNNFDHTVYTSAVHCVGKHFFQVTLPTTDARPVALRLRPYYNSTIFSVAPVDRTLPPQGFEVSSTGKTDSGITRKIIVKKKYEAPASIFDFVLYGNTSISNEAYGL
jgi:hypothetical protein